MIFGKSKQPYFHSFNQRRWFNQLPVAFYNITFAHLWVWLTENHTTCTTMPGVARAEKFKGSNLNFPDPLSPAKP